MAGTGIRLEQSGLDTTGKLELMKKNRQELTGIGTNWNRLELTGTDWHRLERTGIWNGLELTGTRCGRNNVEKKVNSHL